MGSLYLSTFTLKYTLKQLRHVSVVQLLNLCLLKLQLLKYSINLQTQCILYTGCPRRNVPDFGRVFLKLKYTDITQNTYIQS